MLLSCVSALSSVGVREPIVLNMRFDRMLIPLAAVMTEALAFAASLLMFPLMMLVYGVGPTAALLWLPFVVAVTLTLAAGGGVPRRADRTLVPQLQDLRRPVAADRVLRVAGDRGALRDVRRACAGGSISTRSRGSSRRSGTCSCTGRAPEAWQLVYPAFVGLVLAAIFVPLYRHEQRHFAKLVADS